MIDDRDESWKPHAACREEDPSLFFPLDNSVDSRRGTDRAKAICAKCPVRDPCLQYGWRELFGTWGGMSQRERLMARREEFRRDKAWSIALALVMPEVSVPPLGYDEGDVDPDERLAE